MMIGERSRTGEKRKETNIKIHLVPFTFANKINIFSYFQTETHEARQQSLLPSLLHHATGFQQPTRMEPAFIRLCA